MAKLNKKEIRKKFREAVFKRDNNMCRICGKDGPLDAHHIINRNCFENGGYELDNGISLCEECHLKAENLEYSETYLYNLIKELI